MSITHFADLSLTEVARVMGGDAQDGEVRCPGPGHTSADRSLCIRPSSKHPRGFIAFSHSPADEDLDCADYVCEMLGVPNGTDPTDGFPGGPSDEQRRKDREQRIKQAEAEQAKAKALNSKNAERIYNDAEPLMNPIEDNLAHTYLTQGRGIPFDHAQLDAIENLRFAPNHYHGNRKEKFPALIAAYRDIETDEIKGIHRTYLHFTGLKKAGRLSSNEQKKMYGPSKNAAIKLAPIGDDGCLGIAEGIETALTVIAHGWGPVWSVMSANGMKDFPIIDEVQTLTIFADAGEAGVAAAQKCAERWIAAGKSAEIYVARSDDFNSDVGSSR